jgi:hypothetical protein
MPENLWNCAIVVGGILEGILQCCGLVCDVDCVTKMEGESMETEFYVKILAG